MSDASAASASERLLHAKVLVELGELTDAEAEIAEVLDALPDDLTALSLFAKVKHMRGELSRAVGCWAQIPARWPHTAWALMQLPAMLPLAQAPERGAEEFVAIGQFQLAGKPAAN